MPSYFEKEKQNYYEVLDIPPDASATDIRQAYFRAKSAYGKDSNAIYSLFDTSDTKEMLERIEEAYMILSNTDRRKEYDRTHGFLKSDDMESKVSSKKNASTAGAFSFKNENSSKKHNQQSQDPAHQAANAIFGSGSDFSHEQDQTERLRESSTTLASEGKDHHSERNKQPHYNLFNSSERSSAASTALGPVRRTDLVNLDSHDPEQEQSIATETEFRGAFLRKTREYRGISMDELSEFTKISKNYLNCLEAEEFDSLPAPPYVRGFVVQVAKALKIPHDKTAAGYMKHYYSVVSGK